VIVLDTSALIAIVLNEPEAANCATAIEADSDRRISAGTATEAMIVADGRKVGNAMKALFERLRTEIMPVTPIRAERVAKHIATGERAITPPASTSVIVSPTPSLKSWLARWCLSAMTSPAPM
jgi:ribonuclease VapC